MNISSVRLLPYHTLGKGKYAELGREYLMDDGVKITDGEVREIQKRLESNSITCIIEGFLDIRVSLPENNESQKSNLYCWG